MLADIAGWLSVPTVIAPVVVFMIGAGMASPFALTGAVSVNPHAIGAASGLYGFTQMAYGALCTVIVEVWRPGFGADRRCGAAGLGDVGADRAVARRAAAADGVRTITRRRREFGRPGTAREIAQCRARSAAPLAGFRQAVD